MKSDFEDVLGDINAEVFWPEFTFTQNQLNPARMVNWS
jgi:hypothetical protein